MRILIVKLSSIGDVVHTLPAAALLRRALPDARISWVVERAAGAILEGSPVIDEVIVFDTRRWRKNLLNASTARDAADGLSRLRSVSESNGDPSADLAIDFQGLIKSGIIAFASRASRRLGFQTSDLREGASKLFLTEQGATSQFKHVIDKNLALARAAIAISDGKDPYNEAISNHVYEFPIAVSAEDERYVQGIIDLDNGPFCIINP